MSTLVQPSSMTAASAIELARRIEAKDPYTAGHTWRVANYGQILAAALNYPAHQIEMMVYAGTLHDIGKLMVPDDILMKPGRLTDDEFELLKKHPVDGYELLKDLPEFKDVLKVVLMHHEAYNGSGYPYGLSGEEIPHEARLFAVVDAFDAMTSNRCYRPGVPGDNAIYEIWRNRGRQFDPKIADTFTELFREGLLDHVIGFSDFGVKIGNCSQCGPVLELHNGHRLNDDVICPLCGSHYRMELLPGGGFRLVYLEETHSEKSGHYQPTLLGS